MSHDDPPWNPEDGPLPTEQELAEARAFAEAMAGSHRLAQDPALAALVDTAVRARASVHRHPTADAAATVAVDNAVRAAGTVRVRRWTRWAVAAAGLFALASGSAELVRRARTPLPVAPLSRPADDVLRSPLEAGAGSVPSSRLYDSRLHDYRASMLRGRSR